MHKLTGFPIELVLRRGSVFRHWDYEKLDDPALANQTKPKFLVILSASHLDDPVLYLLTTSKQKKQTAPIPDNWHVVAAGSCAFFSCETQINVAETGQTDIGRDDLLLLYEAGRLEYKGCLDQPEIGALMACIKRCRSVENICKQILGL